MSDLEYRLKHDLEPLQPYLSPISKPVLYSLGHLLIFVFCSLLEFRMQFGLAQQRSNYSGIFPCFFSGFLSRLVSSMASA